MLFKNVITPSRRPNPEPHKMLYPESNKGDTPQKIIDDNVIRMTIPVQADAALQIFTQNFIT
jgi:hypothetical protein